MTTGPFGTMLKKFEHMRTGVPVLGIENIGDGRFIPGTKIFVSEEKADKLQPFTVETGDVIISRSGTVGEICEVPDGIGKALISTNLLRVSLNKDVVDSQFFVLMFQGGGTVKSQVKELCKGSSREFLNQDILKSIIFPICSIDEQRTVVAEIASKLSRVEKLLEEIDNHFESAETLRQSILRKAFCGELVAQDPMDESAQTLRERINTGKRAQTHTGRRRAAAA
jgi:type I restriction enzyme, S subunit